MYLDGAGTPFLAGHAASAVTAPALELVPRRGRHRRVLRRVHPPRQPVDTPALVQIDYLLPDGTVIPKAYELAPESRRTVRVDDEHPWLSDTAVSARLHSLNGVPFVAERSMWWADGGWYEAHNSPGAVDDRHALAGLGRRGGRTRSTARPTCCSRTRRRSPARRASPCCSKAAARWSAPWRSRRTAASTWTSAALFPETADRRFGTLVESLGADPAELVVEWSIYGTPGTRPWELGANALAMNLSPPLQTLDRSGHRPRRRHRRPSRRAAPSPATAAPTFSVTSSSPGVATVTIDAATGRCSSRRERHRHRRPSRSRRASPASPTSSTPSCVTVIPGRAIRFGAAAVLGSLLFPAFADMNGDGRLELVGHAQRSAARSCRRTCARSASARSSISSPPRTTARTAPSTSTATAASTSSPGPTCRSPTRAASPASSSAGRRHLRRGSGLHRARRPRLRPQHRRRRLRQRRRRRPVHGRVHAQRSARAVLPAAERRRRDTSPTSPTRPASPTAAGRSSASRRARRRSTSTATATSTSTPPATSTSTRASSTASRASSIAAPRSACRCASTKGCGSSTPTTTAASICCCSTRAKARSCGASPAPSSSWRRCRSTSTTAATAPTPATSTATASRT